MIFSLPLSNKTRQQSTHQIGDLVFSSIPKGATSPIPSTHIFEDKYTHTMEEKMRKVISNPSSDVCVDMPGRTWEHQTTVERQKEKKKKLGHFWHSKKSLDSVNIEIFEAFDVAMSTIRDYHPTHKPALSCSFAVGWSWLETEKRWWCRPVAGALVGAAELFFFDDERRKFYCHIVRHSDSTLPLAPSPSCCHDSLCFMILKAMNRLEQWGWVSECARRALTVRWKISTTFHFPSEFLFSRRDEIKRREKSFFFFGERTRKEFFGRKLKMFACYLWVVISTFLFRYGEGRKKKKIS